MRVIFGDMNYSAGILPESADPMTFTGKIPMYNDSVKVFPKGSSCETCLHSVGSKVADLVTIPLGQALVLRGSHRFREYKDIPFVPCSLQKGESNPAGICPKFERDYGVQISQS